MFELAVAEAPAVISAVGLVAPEVKAEVVKIFLVEAAAAAEVVVVVLSFVVISIKAGFFFQIDDRNIMAFMVTTLIIP